jgi:CRP-like cAMP-binding protein
MPYPIRDLRVRKARASFVDDPTDLDVGERLEILNRTALFDAMPERERLALAETAESVLYSAGEAVVFEGDTGDDLYIVARGEVVALTQTASGEALELARIGVGHLFGEISLLTGVRGATIKAAEESVVLRISHAEFRRITSNVEGLAEGLLSRLLERQAKMSRPEELGMHPDLDNGLVRSALLDRIRRFFSP